jgi:site-specific DNA-adenine methylase
MDIKVTNWYGGKLRMVSKLKALIPAHKVYCEPFMGSAALLLNKVRSEQEITCDLDSGMVCLMSTLTDAVKGHELVNKLCSLEYNEMLFNHAKECQKNGYAGMNDIEKSVAVYTLVSQSFNATGKGFSKKLYKSTSDYQRTIKLHLPQAYKRLQGVDIRYCNGIDMLSKLADVEDAFVFADPPYCHELRGESATNIYGCEMSEMEHIRMLEIMQKAKCKIILCGYKAEKNDLYDRYLLPHGWHCYKLCDIAKSCKPAEKRDFAEEFIWVNYELPDAAKYVISLKEHSSL